MRTIGTFQDVYQQARAYSNGENGQPHNPVVRLENGKWIIESGLEPQHETEFECTLDAFDMWFYESYKNDNYVPGDADQADFMDATV